MRYHNRLAELVAAKKGGDYATTVQFKFPLLSLGRLYSVLEGQEQLKQQFEVMFKKRTFNWIDALPKSRSYNFYNFLFI